MLVGNARRFKIKDIAKTCWIHHVLDYAKTIGKAETDFNPYRSHPNKFSTWKMTP